MRLVLATIHGAAKRILAIVVQNQVGMSARAVEPALDSSLRLCNRGAHRVLSGGAVGVSRRAGDVAFLLQTLAQLLIGLPNMLAQNVSAGGLVLAEVAHRSIRLAELSSRRRTRPIRGRGLTRDQAAHC